MSAGMGSVAGPELVAAVSNAGGIGTIGGVRYSPQALRRVIKELKSYLVDPNLPWGVDLLLPQVGGNARATNTDYTEGKLEDLVDGGLLTVGRTGEVGRFSGLRSDLVFLLSIALSPFSFRTSFF